MLAIIPPAQVAEEVGSPVTYVVVIVAIIVVTFAICFGVYQASKRHHWADPNNVFAPFTWQIEGLKKPQKVLSNVPSELMSEGQNPMGMPIKKLNTRQIRWKMMQLQPNITFFSLNLRGNSLTVVAYGSTDPPEVLDEHAITKVVAARDGVVTQVRALEGQPMVRAGDAVQTGDTLISGLVEPTREGGKYRTAHARGTVQAYTTHTVQAARPLTEQSKRYTGKIRHQYALVMGNKRLNFYIGSGITGGTCDKIITTRHFWLSDSVVLPVALVTQTYTFYEREPTTCTAEDVRVDMLSRALGETAADIDGMVTSHSETLTEQNGAAVLYLPVHAEEQIGTEAVDDSAIPEENVEMEQVP